MNNVQNIYFLENQLLDIQPTYSSEFSIGQNTYETPFLYGKKSVLLLMTLNLTLELNNN